MKRSLTRHGVTLSSIVLGVVLFAMFALAAMIISFSTYFPASNPLNLTPLLPRIDGYLAGMGLKLTASRMIAYYQDGNIVLQGDDLRVYSTSGELAVVVEKGAVELSRRRLFMGIPAPKLLNAENVTLRLVRSGDVVQLAGIPLASGEEESNMGDAVAWLNGTAAGLRWGALERGQIKDLTLLLRDEVQQSEWVMEDGLLTFARTAEGGERATLAANLRRLYGGKDIAPTPVLAVFEHAAGAGTAMLRARLEKSDVDMVADYFPPQIENMFKAKGRVEVGMLLTEGNRLGQPWLTLRLTDVAITVPEGFSKPLTFKNFDVTASYKPEPDDLLSINSLRAVDDNGLVIEGRGAVVGLGSASVVELDTPQEVAAALAQGISPTATASGTLVVSATESTPPEQVRTVSSTLAANITLRVANGKAQDAFQYFPDRDRRFIKTLAWLRPNILEGGFTNLVLTYKGRPADFPDCGNACGLAITADITKGGRVRYLDNVMPATVQSPGKLQLVGETLRISVPRASTGSQTGDNVMVDITELFSPVPTVIKVRTKLSGPLDEVIREVGKIKKPLPLSGDGRHTSDFALDLPLIKGKPTELEDADIAVQSNLADITLSRFEDIKNTRLTASSGTFRMKGNMAYFAADGALNGNPMDVDWQDDWKTGAKAMKLTARGTVDASWLEANGLPKDIQIEGPVSVDLALQQSGKGNSLILTADGRRAGIKAPSFAFNKPAGEAFTLKTSGSYQGNAAALGRLQLDKLALDGKGIDVQGNLTYVPSNLAATRVSLSPFRLGKTDAVLNWNGQQLNLSGHQLDATPFMDDSSGGTTLPESLSANINVQSLLLPKGTLQNLKASFSRRGGVWDVDHLSAMANGQSAVNVTTQSLAGQPGRRRMGVNIQNLGQLLAITNVYDRLLGGRLEGQINYDAPTVGGGVLVLRDFQLDNPPTLVRLLSLLSLPQLLEGTDKLRFDKGTFPLRLDGSKLYLDKAVMDGPAMTLRLDGMYDRADSTMNIDGRLAPAIPFNRLIAKIPLIGTLLTGSQDGVVVADFKMKGASADPKIEVRPLSILTPGLIKDIFRGGDSSPSPNVESNVP